jgi:hypothetical protein
VSTGSVNGDGGIGDSSVGIAVGMTIVVLILGIGAFIYARRRRQQQHLPPLPAQPATMAMYVNPLHPDFSTGTPDYEEPVTLQHDGNLALVGVDAELYVADPRTASSSGSYAVFQSAKSANDAAYSVFRSQVLAQNPDATV